MSLVKVQANSVRVAVYIQLFLRGSGDLISTLLFDDLRSLKTDKQLMFCDLPRNISVLESPFKISYLDNKYGFLNPGQSMSFLFQNKHNSISYQRILHEFYTKKECYISF